MSVAEELQNLERMSFRQLLAILLTGLVVWWLVSQIFAGSLQLLLLWLIGTDIELGTELFMDGIYESVVKSLGNIVGVIAGLWVGYGTFCKFKKDPRSNVDDLQGLGQMNLHQIGMIAGSGVLAWWLMSVSFKLAVYSWALWWGSDTNMALANLVIQTKFAVVIANPIIGLVSLVVGLWVGHSVFSRYRASLDVRSRIVETAST